MKNLSGLVLCVMLHLTSMACGSTLGNLHRREKRQSNNAPCVLTLDIVECLGNDATLDSVSETALGESLREVVTVSLVGAAVPSLPPAAFLHIPALEALTVSGSRLQQIQAESFEGIETLQRLNLSSNELDNLDAQNFLLLKNLKRLNLTMNKIKSISADGLEGLNELQILDLSSNNLDTLPQGIFKYTPALMQLDLSKNQITRIPTKVFNNLDSLVAVDFSRNKLVQLPAKFFENVPNLARIVFSRNNLRTFPSEVFSQSLDRLVLLRLDGNELSHVDASALVQRAPNLVRAGVVPNPWRCACLNALLSALATKGVEYYNKDFFDGTRPVCVVDEGAGTSTSSKPSSRDVQGSVRAQCKVPTQPEGTALRATYRGILNNYNKPT